MQECGVGSSGLAVYHDCNGVVDGLFISFIDDDGCNDVD